MREHVGYPGALRPAPGQIAAAGDDRRHPAARKGLIRGACHQFLSVIVARAVAVPVVTASASMV